MASDNRVNKNNLRNVFMKNGLSFKKNNEDENGISDVTERELSFKSEKARAKTNFTRTWNKVLFLIEKHRLPSSREIEDACDRLDSAMDRLWTRWPPYRSCTCKKKRYGKSKKGYYRNGHDERGMCHII